MKNPRISLVVRCFNEEKHIGKLLVGLSRQTLKDHEVIVVDSGSTDDTLQIVKRFPCKVVQIDPKEFSFGRALNLGCKEASGEFLVFASAHVYPVYEDWLECLIKPFSKSEIGLVYGKQSGTDTTQFSEHRIFESWFPNKSELIKDNPFCNNANCAIRKSLWNEMPYNEELTGLEDLEWANRLVKRGLKLSYSAEAEIIHVHEERPHQIFNRYRREALALKRIYPEQKMNIFDFFSLFIRNISKDLWVALKEKKVIEVFLDVIAFRWYQFKGAYIGLNEKSELTQQLKKTFYYPAGTKSHRGSHSGEKINYEVT